MFVQGPEQQGPSCRRTLGNHYITIFGGSLGGSGWRTSCVMNACLFLHYIYIHTHAHTIIYTLHTYCDTCVCDWVCVFAGSCVKLDNLSDIFDDKVLWVIRNHCNFSESCGRRLRNSLTQTPAALRFGNPCLPVHGRNVHHVKPGNSKSPNIIKRS